MPLLRILRIGGRAVVLVGPQAVARRVERPTPVVLRVVAVRPVARPTRVVLRAAAPLVVHWVVLAWAAAVARARRAMT